MIATNARRPAKGQRALAPEIDELSVRARIDGILNRHPAVGFAVGVVRHGRLELFSAHGMADVHSKTPITEDTIFRIASISKTFTAIAVMQLWELGRVDLDAPANDYLRSYQLIAANPAFRPATLRHLLTHTSGMPEMVNVRRSLGYIFGESVELGQPLPSLAEYYQGRLNLKAEPGTRFAYTDHNFATVGQIVEDVSGIPLDQYFREHIFAPLGMTDTDLLRSAHVEARLATGYTFGPRGPKAVTDRQWVTAAASSIYSSPRDMARYVAALLGGGSNEHGTVLEPATLRMMFEPQYQPDPRIPGMGLAFSRVELGGEPAVEHEGVLPGFNSQIFMAPGRGIGVMAFTNGARQAMFWLPAEVAGLLSQLLGVPEEGIRTDVPQHPEIWGDLCGWYPFSGPVTDMRARSMLGAGAEVFVRNGQLMIRVLSPIPAGYRGFVLHPDNANDPDVFRMDASKLGLGTVRIVFTRDPAGTATRVHLDLLPMSLQKRPAIENPRLWITGAVGAVVAGAAGVAAVRHARKTFRPGR